MAIVSLECECARRGFPFAGRALLGSKRLFLCPCGYSTNRKWVLQRHQATRHPNMRRQQLRACSNCGTNLTIDTGWGTYRSAHRVVTNQHWSPNWLCSWASLIIYAIGSSCYNLQNHVGCSSSAGRYTPNEQSMEIGVDRVHEHMVHILCHLL